jgi:hypothetical protein
MARTSMNCAGGAAMLGHRGVERLADKDLLALPPGQMV